jgi:Copper amine oxidase N-terminal domain
VNKGSAAITAALVALGVSTSPISAQQPAEGPSADFGTPPSGEVPILFNDEHVYSRPSLLNQNRVLSALVRGREVLVPLRSMFEQMGATVSYDPASKTADVSKPGSDVKVTVGKPEVVINGESRPLDAPPEIYKGAIVVPVRVISESMGAYVQWVPEKKVVVVRYVAAPVPTPPPTAPPTEAPTPAPAPPPAETAAPQAPTATSVPPAPVPKKATYEHFIVGDYIGAPNVSNQFSPNENKTIWGPSYAGRAAIEFAVSGVPFMAEGYGEQYAYTHPAGSVATIGGTGSTFVPQFSPIDGDVSARLGVKVAKPRIYVAAAYMVTSNNYGYPRTHGFGYGVEKLPDLDRTLSFFGSYYYYPENEGGFIDPSSGGNYLLQYRFQQYQAGLTYKLPFRGNAVGVFFEAGFMGNQATNKQFLPINGHESGGFAGFGIHF